MSVTRAVFDHFDAEAGQYADRSAGWLWGPLRRREGRAVMAALDPRPGERVLDAGCGAGHYTLQIAAAGAEVSGVDGAQAMVDAARARGFDVALHDLEASPPPGGPFDKVLCAGALEFCGDPARVVANLAEALTPGGRVVLFMPRLSVLGRLYRRHHRRHGLAIHLFGRAAVAAWQSESLHLSELRRVAFSWVATFERPS